MTHAEVPVSRFWSCFFASTIFALIWTQKMKKTRKWLVIVIAPVMLPLVAMPYMALDAGDDMPDAVAGFAAISYVAVLYAAGPAVAIYFMFRWTTGYNLANFGLKSKGEWKRASDAADDSS